MNGRSFGSRALTAASMLALALLAAKSLAVFVSAAAMRHVDDQRRQLQVLGKRPSAEGLIGETDALLRALRTTPGDADRWHQLGRNLQRVADNDAVLGDAVRRRLIAMFDLRLPAWQEKGTKMRLAAAAAAYTRAIAANRVASGARFWRVVAENGLADNDPQAWAERDKQRVVEALRYDPQDPGLLLAAGQLALLNADLPSALGWFRQSLAWNIDGIETVAEDLLAAPDGDRRFAEVLPNKAEAWRRLARFLYAAWRFREARDAFETAMKLAGEEAVWAPYGQALLDSSFDEDPDLLLHPWKMTDVRGVQLDRDSRDGVSYLLATFQGGPGNWHHVSQEAQLIPGRRYVLSAAVKVEGFAPSETFGVEAVHPFDLSLFAAEAKCLAGGLPSKYLPEKLPVCRDAFVKLETEFTAPPGVRMLNVRLRRFGGSAMASGRAFFTDVSLRLVRDEGDFDEETAGE